jgi:hypothetical protein
MADPRLNSLHLESKRREKYRRAREALLNARGPHSQFDNTESDSSDLGRTIIPKNDAAGRQLSCWLTDGEFLYPLQVGLNTLGRSQDNNVIVEDGYVSRRHCAILIHSSEIAELHDTASKNGTYLNGQKLSAPAVLKCGDEIRLSDRQYVFFTRPGVGNESFHDATLHS